MSDYAIGGWSQDLNAQPPSEFTYTMFGMVTNLNSLTTGAGWGPGNHQAPNTPGKTLWTYGGQGAAPAGMPATQSDITAIVNANNAGDWDGVDFDDESSMNVDNLVATMKGLEGKEKSYTFLAGWAYNNPTDANGGNAINTSVKNIAAEGVCDRFVLMCYADTMWDMNDIENNVPQAIKRTMGYVGDSKKVYLALTPAGLNSTNLQYFLNQVTANNLGGLLVWDYPALLPADLDTIVSTLGIAATV